MSVQTDLPPEFNIPRAAANRHLALLAAATARPLRTSPRRFRSLAIGIAVVALAGATLAVAATNVLFDRDVTRADIDARLTTTTRTVQECAAPGDCGPRRFETIGVIKLQAADGVTFVAPDGRLLSVTPATSMFGFESPSEYGDEFSRSRQDNGTTQIASLDLPDGGTRTFSWVSGEGTVSVIDVSANRSRSVKELHSGDIVELLPGSLSDAPLTPDKAVTLDLEMLGYPVWIYPQRNEVYIGKMPWRTDSGSVDISAEIARHYDLIEQADGDYVIPTATVGGSWSFTLDNGTIRTVSWKAGEGAVTVTDRDSEGHVLGAETVAIGRRVEAG